MGKPLELEALKLAADALKKVRRLGGLLAPAVGTCCAHPHCVLGRGGYMSGARDAHAAVS